MENKGESCFIYEEKIDKNSAYLEGSRISFTFLGKTPTIALKNISFKIREGSINAIIGESGSGKSTLLKVIYGLLEPNTGTVRFKGSRILGPNEKLIPGHEEMRIVSQNFEDLNLYASVWENISAELSNDNVSAKSRKTKTILNRLRILHLKDHRIFDLSGGEKQRVAIAKALVKQPAILLMDEPFNQVDASFREELQEDIRQIVLDTKLTILLVSHDPAEVLSLADKLMVLKNGRLMGVGSPSDLFHNPPNTYTARLLAKANVLNAADAARLGIDSLQKVIIHPHQVSFSENDAGIFYIKQIRFKGAHKEIILGHGDDKNWELNVMDLSEDTRSIDTKVQPIIHRYIEVKQ